MQRGGALFVCARLYTSKKGSKRMAKAKKKKAKEPESQSACLGYLRELHKLQDAVLKKMDAGKDKYGEGK